VNLFPLSRIKGDFNTSRQLLILYTLVASRGTKDKEKEICHSDADGDKRHHSRRLSRQISSMSLEGEMKSSMTQGNPSDLPPPPPPTPLGTDRLRSATNSDGLLAVLGAAEVLKSAGTSAS